MSKEFLAFTKNLQDNLASINSFEDSHRKTLKNPRDSSADLPDNQKYQLILSAIRW